MLNYAETASISTIVPITPMSPSEYQRDSVNHVSSLSSYVIGPIDPSHLIAMHAHCSSGEECPLLVPKSLPLWILNHPEFRDGYERNFFTEEGEEDEEWRGTIPHMVNLIYSKLRGEGFADPTSGEVDPDFGAWEIGSLLRDFTRLADTDRTLALTGMAHLCFLVSFLPPELPGCWPPAGLVQAHAPHNDAVKAYRAQVRVYREQGKSYAEAQQLALAKQEGSALPMLEQMHAATPVLSLSALLAHPEFQHGVADAQATFLNEYEPAPLTEEEMIENVEEWISRDGFELDKTVCQVSGFEPHTYFYNLGLTIGTIDQGLTYQTGSLRQEATSC